LNNLRFAGRRRGLGGNSHGGQTGCQSEQEQDGFWLHARLCNDSRKFEQAEIVILAATFALCLAGMGVKLIG